MANADRRFEGRYTSGQRIPVARWDLLLSELQFAQRSAKPHGYPIRSYVAQDSKTGLSNRLFFDNQLSTLLEDQEKVGSYGIVMMIRLPDFDLLRDNWGRAATEEHYFTLINMLSTFIMRYPGALLARYHRSDFAVLLPHRTLKEADSIAGLLLKAMDARRRREFSIVTI